MPREKITGNPVKKLTCNHDWEYVGSGVSFKNPAVSGYEQPIKSKYKQYRCNICGCTKTVTWKGKELVND